MANDNGAHALFARAGGLYPPPSVISAWPRPNHVNPETRGWGVPIMLTAFLMITFIVYSARMWARLMVAKNAGLDDLLISIAMIFVVGSTVAVILGKCASLRIRDSDSDLHRHSYIWLSMACLGSDTTDNNHY